MKTRIILFNRILLVLLAALPVLYIKPFYHHFHVYLTGTAIIGIVKEQWHLVVISIVVFGLFLIPLTYRKRARWVDYGLVGAFFVSASLISPPLDTQNSAIYLVLDRTF